MVRAMRSLIEPPGFWFSSLTNSWQRPLSRWVSGKIGVLPIMSSKGLADIVLALRDPVDRIAESGLRLNL
ncbi:hypothetical protein D3C85_814290 [compost metagenome]